MEERRAYANRRRSADQRKLIGHEGAIRRQRNRSRRVHGSNNRTDRSGAARLDPGLLQIAGYRSYRRRRDIGPPHGEGACQTEHGRRAGRGRGLQKRADAECHCPRGGRQSGCASRATRRTRRILRRGNKGRRSRQAQRHRSLPTVDRTRGQRISGRPVWRRRLHSGDIPAVQRTRRQGAWASHCGRRRQGRSRSFHGRAQSRVESRVGH